MTHDIIFVEVKEITSTIFALPKDVKEMAEFYALDSVSLSQLAEVVEKKKLSWSEEQQLMESAMEYAHVYAAEYDRQMNLAEAMYEP